MPIRVECPNPKCKKALQAPDTHAGKKARCPGCGHIITIPDPDTVLMEAGADPLIGGTLGHLEIKEKLGQGGMGAVYLGINTSLDRMAAVKVIPEELIKRGPSFLDRFLREARMAAKLNHPNAVIVYFVGEDKGRHFIEMEYVQGMDLRQVIQREGRLEMKEASRIIADAARALAAAHKQGIVHRDIKPDNIMLTEEGQVKVADFGLARVSAADSGITVSGQVIGTPLYMAPEQGQGKPTDGRTDIYSLGATYYHAVTGKVPFTADTPLQVMVKHLQEPLVWPKGAENIPAPIKAIVEKMMAKRPEDRYRTCDEVIGAIESYFKPKPVVAQAVEVVVAVQAEVPIAAAPKDAYVLSAADLAAIESAGREIRHTTPSRTKPTKPITRKKMGTVPPSAGQSGLSPFSSISRWLLSVVGMGLVVAVVAIAVAIKGKGGPPSPGEHAQTSLGVAPGVETAKDKKKEEPGWKEPEGPQPYETYSQPAVTKSYDVAYVATAATGEKIPHPLSRKTYKVRYKGEIFEFPEGMVYVPAGEFTMGERESEHKVYLDAYFIGKYEVTNAEWKAFCDATGFQPLPTHWTGGKIPEGKENHPVIYVSWEDAQKYCEWVNESAGARVGEFAGWQVRLPTEAQWEKAAAWNPEKKIKSTYPWGGTWDARLCNSGYTLLEKYGFRPTDDVAYSKMWEEFEKKNAEWYKKVSSENTMPVGSYKGVKTFYGCYDTAGNAHEFCQDWFKSDYYLLKDARNNPQGPNEEEAEEAQVSDYKGKARLLRGGAWYSLSFHCRATTRARNSPSSRNRSCGFRIVLSGRP